MLKLLGMVLILFSGLSFGMSISQIYTKRTQAIQSLLQALDIMEKEISCRLTPIPDIIHSLAQNTAQPYSIFFRHLDQAILQEPSVSLSLQWRKSLREIQDVMGLPDTVYSVLASFSDVIGKYEAEEQQRTIFYISDRLKDCLRLAEQEKQNKGKVYKTCSIATGLLLVILLF